MQPISYEIPAICEAICGFAGKCFAEWRARANISLITILFDQFSFVFQNYSKV